MATKLGKIAADFTTALATALAIGGESATLQNATDDDGVALPAGRYFFAIDGNNSSKEHISCDLSGTSLTNIKSLSRQGAETTGVNLAHRIGATVTLTDFAHIKFINDLVSGATSFNAAVPLGYDGAPTFSSDNQLVTKKYVADTITGAVGTATEAVSGTTKLSVAPATPGQPIAVGDNDNRVSPVSLATLTADQVAALDGTGTPNGTTGKYVTNDDTTGTGSVLRASTISALTKFGGTGADGALAITTGTTTIDCANAAVVVKNYASISITGDGVLAFSNPHANGTIVILKSQGNVTLTSSATPMIDMSGMGGAGGAAKTSTGDVAGEVGTGSFGFLTTNTAATAGLLSNTTSAGGTFSFTMKNLFNQYLLRYPNIFTGAGGGSGALSSSGDGVSRTSGAGGRGGGGLVIECGGAWNFTTASGISVAGKNGGNPSGTGTRGYAQGGSPGAGGYFLGLYNTLTANTGTVVATAGTVGTGTVQIGAGTGANTAPSGAASGINNGTAVTGVASNAVSAPGASGDGYSLVALNTEIS